MSRMQPGYVAMPCNNGLHSGKCPTVPTLRASSFITPYGNIPNKLIGSTISCIVSGCFLCQAKTRSVHWIEIKQLEQKLQALLIQWQPEQLKNVSSIKGIGKRAAAMLIVFTQGFKYTQNNRQLISFAGLAPTQYSSGSSIQGKPRIYKRGAKT